MVRLAGHLLMPPGAASHYTTYAITTDLVFRNLRFYLSQTPDVIVMGLAAGIAGIVSISVALRSDIQCDVRKMVSSIAFFLAGAAYVVGQLIWRWPFGYYLLIPAAFFSVSGVLFASMAPMASFRKSMIGLGVVVLLTRLYSVPYFVYIARAQISQDRIFSEIINDYMAAASSGQRLLAVDWPFYAEPVSQANILVSKIYRRQNLQVTGIESCVRDLELTPEVLSLYGVTEIPDTGALAPRAGDFIVLDVGKRPSRWVLRGISPFGGRETADADSLLKILSDGDRFVFKRVSGDTFGWKGIELHPFGVRLKGLCLRIRDVSGIEIAVAPRTRNRRRA